MVRSVKPCVGIWRAAAVRMACSASLKRSRGGGSLGWSKEWKERTAAEGAAGLGRAEEGRRAQGRCAMDVVDTTDAIGVVDDSARHWPFAAGRRRTSLRAAEAATVGERADGGIAGRWLLLSRGRWTEWRKQLGPVARQTLYIEEIVYW